MARLLYRLGRNAFARRWLFLFGWIGVVALSGFAAVTMSGETSQGMKACVAELCCLELSLVHGCSSQVGVGCGCEDARLPRAPSSAGAAARIPRATSPANVSRLTRVDAI